MKYGYMGEAWFAKTSLACQHIIDMLVKLSVSSVVTFEPESCRTTPPPYSSASAGRTSAWCLRATRAWVLTGAWWSCSGFLTPSSSTPRSPSSMTSPWRTGWFASSPTGPSFTRWGGITNKRNCSLVVCFFLLQQTMKSKPGNGGEIGLGVEAWVKFEIMWLRSRELCQFYYLGIGFYEYKSMWSVNTKSCGLSKQQQGPVSIFQALIALCARAWQALGKLLKLELPWLSD